MLLKTKIKFHILLIRLACFFGYFHFSINLSIVILIKHTKNLKTTPNYI